MGTVKRDADGYRTFPDACYPEIERLALSTGWWRYSQQRTAQREEAYRESARGLRGVWEVLQGMAQRVVYGRRGWKPQRINGRVYIVEDGA